MLKRMLMEPETRPDRGAERLSTAASESPGWTQKVVTVLKCHSSAAAGELKTACCVRYAHAWALHATVADVLWQELPLPRPHIMPARPKK